MLHSLYGCTCKYIQSYAFRRRLIQESTAYSLQLTVMNYEA